MNNRAVVIVAAGSGRRMGQRDKALLPISGVPAIVHSIRAAASTEGVALIVLVTREDLVADMAQIASDADAEQLISVVTGGESRTGSVTNGVRKAAELGFELVAVHDAARPLSTTAMFEAVFDEVERSGAAIVAIPVADTLKRVDDAGVIEGTVNRSGLWAAQTPQAFRTRELLEALDRAADAGITATDEASLYESLGRPVKVVQGSVTNLKLTWPGDHELASFLFERQSTNEETNR